MLASLREAAIAAGHPEWGHGGPHDSGNYNSHSSETGFFKSYGGSWDTGARGSRAAPACWVAFVRGSFAACRRRQGMHCCGCSVVNSLTVLLLSLPCPVDSSHTQLTPSPLLLPGSPSRLRPLLPLLVLWPAHPACRPAAGRSQGAAQPAVPAAGDARGARAVRRRHALRV